MKPRNIQEALDLATSLSKTELVPKHLRGRPSETLLLIMNALSRGRDVLDHLSSRYVVHGQVGMTAVAMIAEANASGIFKGVLRFEWTGKGPDLACRCYAIEASTDAELEFTFTLQEARQAGFTKNNKYTEMPKQMLAYRAATFFVRLYCPHVLAGAMTDMEIREVQLDTSADEKRVEELNAELAALPASDDKNGRDQGRSALVEWMKSGNSDVTARQAFRSLSSKFGNTADVEEALLSLVEDKVVAKRYTTVSAKGGRQTATYSLITE